MVSSTKVEMNKLLQDLPAEEYHGLAGSFSSSQLKVLLQDEELFYKKYIERSIPNESIAAFDIGSYFHAAVLEPHTMERDFAVFGGLARRGKEWEEFKALHEGKIILTTSQAKQAEELKVAVHESPVAMDLLKNCTPEISAFLEVYILDGEVYAIRDDVCHILSVASGWIPERSMDVEALREFSVAIVLKVRADALSKVDEKGNGYILDLKSTSGSVKDDQDISKKVASYDYDLSASLYLDVFSFVTNANYDRFYWTWASKETKTSRTTYSSDKYVMVGRAKWRHAVIKGAKFLSNNWTFVDEVGVSEPPFFVLDWLSNN